MSIYVISSVWRNGPEKQGHLLVLLALADYANDEGECWPSIASIAQKARMTERGTQKILRQLEAEGWVKITTGNGRKGCNRYVINPERETPNVDAKTPNDVHPEHRSPRTTFTPNVDAKTPNVDAKTPNVDTPEPSRTVIEPSENLIGGDNAPDPPKRRRAIAIPENWVPSDANIQHALSKKLSPEEIDNEADQFRNHHLARGTTFKDWDAAWRTWVGNAIKFGRVNMACSPAPSRYGQGGGIAGAVARRRAGGSI